MFLLTTTTACTAFSAIPLCPISPFFPVHIPTAHFLLFALLSSHPSRYRPLSQSETNGTSYKSKPEQYQFISTFSYTSNRDFGISYSRSKIAIADSDSSDVCDASHHDHTCRIAISGRSTIHSNSAATDKHQYCWRSATQEWGTASGGNLSW